MAKQLLILLFVSCVAARSNKLDDSIMEVTCLGKYTGVFHSFVYFAEGNSTDYYAIRTPWLLTYPGRIKTRLSNVTLFEKNPVSKCGWTTLAHVKKMGVSTGTVYRHDAENKRVQQGALDVLSSIYPSLEIALLVIGCFFAFIVLVALGIYFKSS